MKNVRRATSVKGKTSVKREEHWQKVVCARNPAVQATRFVFAVAYRFPYDVRRAAGTPRSDRIVDTSVPAHVL